MTKRKLPRGIRRRGDSLVVAFTLKDGTLERRSLGPVSLRYAIQEREIFKREVAEGRYGKATLKKSIQKEARVSSLWPVYQTNYQNEGGRDRERQEIAWAHLKPTFGSLPISEVTTEMIVAYIDSRRAQGRANGTINRELAVLKVMFALGMKSTGPAGKPMVDRIPAFPSKLKEGEPRKGFIKDAQYEVLLANAKAPWLRAFIACAYNFGFRKNELLSLRVAAVDLLDRWICLSGADTKSGKPRKVKMTTMVLELMCVCIRGKNPDAYVFTRNDGSRVVDPREDWYSLCIAAGLGRRVPAKRRDGEAYQKYEGLHIHDFRRSAIRNMVRRGISDTVAMKISGHSTRSIFDRYNITDEQDLEHASLLIESGQQTPEATKSDTQSDTSSFTESHDSRNSLN